MWKNCVQVFKNKIGCIPFLGVHNRFNGHIIPNPLLLFSKQIEIFETSHQQPWTILIYRQTTVA